MFNGTTTPAGTPFGIQQTLTSTLTANTTYNLLVDVGNTPPSGGFFPGFPGYEVDLLAGSTVVASSTSLTPAEGTFGLANLSFTALPGSALLGQALTIRLLDRDNVSASSPAGNGVDFDDVRLNATPAVPEASTTVSLGLMLALGLGGLVVAAKRRKGAA